MVLSFPLDLKSDKIKYEVEYLQFFNVSCIISTHRWKAFLNDTVSEECACVNLQLYHTGNVMTQTADRSLYQLFNPLMMCKYLSKKTHATYNMRERGTIEQ